MENKNTEATHEVDIHISNWWRCVTSLEQKGDTLEITYDKGRLENENSDLKTIDPSIHEPTGKDEFSSVALKFEKKFPSFIDKDKYEEISFRVIHDNKELERLGELFKADQLGERGYSRTIFLTEVRGEVFEDVDEKTGKNTIKEIEFFYCYFDTANFIGSTFNNARFSYSTFNNANFYNSTFNNQANFSYSTFSTANFHGSTFSTANFQNSTLNTADFGYSDFNEAHFEGSTFNNEACFEESTFNKADFYKSNFNKKADFSRCDFNTTDFMGSIFNDKADFRISTFNKTANFNNSTFNTADFMGSIFNDKANFHNATFKKIANFSSLKKCESIAFNNATINFLDIKSSSLPLLSLKGAQIEKIDFTNTVIESSEHRETFTVLKNIALKQNDQISALDFYQKEMFTYFKELTWQEEIKKKTKGIFSKKLILFIEKWISNYGTSWVRALVWILGFNLLIALLMNVGEVGFFELSFKFIADLPWRDILLQTIYNMNVFERVDYEDGAMRVINAIRLAGNAFLYYELIKSLRMFSRKL